MGLYAEYVARTSAARLAQLLNAEAPAGVVLTALTGTLAVANGSAAVVGTGTAFTTELSVGSIIIFASQPNACYTVLAIADATHMTLGLVYGGPTAAATTGQLVGANVVALQEAVADAQVHFETYTGDTYDDTTLTSRAAVPPTVNRCHWIGQALVTAYLYEYRAHPWPDAEVSKAWELAEARLRRYFTQVGSGRRATPGTDSPFTPSTPMGPYPIRPDTDRQNFGRVALNDPRPGGDGLRGGRGSEFGL